MTIARPHAGETRKRDESMTSTNGCPAARASAGRPPGQPQVGRRVGGDRLDDAADVGQGRRPDGRRRRADRRRRARVEDVDRGRTRPGRRPPIGAVDLDPPGARGRDRRASRRTRPPSRRAAGPGSPRPAAPIGSPVTDTSWTVGRIAVSSRRAPSAERVRMIGPGSPDQTDDETTSTPRAPVAARWQRRASARRCRRIGRRRAARHGVATTVRSTAVIASDVVPNGNEARKAPVGVDQVDVGGVRHRIGAGRVRSRPASSGPPRRRPSNGSAPPSRSGPRSRPAGSGRIRSARPACRAPGRRSRRRPSVPVRTSPSPGPTVPIVAGQTSGQWV